MRFLSARIARFPRSLRVLAGGAIVACAGVASGQSGDGKQAPPFERGRDLFITNWKPNLEADAKSDGLGPLYNEISCVACHKQGGIGGSGENEKNVVLLTRLTPVASLVQRVFGDNSAPADLGAVHPAFEDRTATSIVLHEHHTKPMYAPWRREIVESATSQPPRELNLPSDTGLRFIERDGIHYMLSERSAPSLFGAGLINRISADAIREEAERQARDKDSIAGQVPVVGSDVGRFGWRGQIASLRDFVAGACANELGLTVDDHRQPADPLNEQETQPSVDMEFKDVNAIAQFVAALPRPVETDGHNKEIARGRKLFRTVGCAKCHLEKLDEVQGIYSDLLLHNLGPKLSDVALPSPTATAVAQARLPRQQGNALGRAIEALPSRDVLTPTAATIASYYGAPSSSSLASVSSSWRTPPLWGVADTGPYLHDGRAESLEDAIDLHEGEAAGVTARYRNLPRMAKLNLIDFLETLEAPQ